MSVAYLPCKDVRLTGEFDIRRLWLMNCMMNRQLLGLIFYCNVFPYFTFSLFDAIEIWRQLRDMTKNAISSNGRILLKWVNHENMWQNESLNFLGKSRRFLLRSFIERYTNVLVIQSSSRNSIVDSTSVCGSSETLKTEVRFLVTAFKISFFAFSPFLASIFSLLCKTSQRIQRLETIADACLQFCGLF